MGKKPNISKEAQVLLKLLRIALGTEPRKYFGEVVEPFPEGIDWKEVVRLSYEHKVSAIAVDGLEASKYDPYKGLDEKQMEELKAVLVPWIKDVENTEWSYCYYVEVLKTLCQIFRDNGLTPIILKGYGLSLNYPRPSHRGAGDIDIFLIDKDGKPAAEDGDRILGNVLKLQREIDKTTHHTHYLFKGIIVENHYELSSPKKGTNEEYQFLSSLKELLPNSIVPVPEIIGAYMPNQTFNELFVKWHIYSHIFGTGITIRQLCDYLLVIRNNPQGIDWNSNGRLTTACGLDRFANALQGVYIEYGGVSESLFLPTFKFDKAISSKMVEDFATFEKNRSRRYWSCLSFFKNRWHYRFYQDTYWLIPMIKFVIQRMVSKYPLLIDNNATK